MKNLQSIPISQIGVGKSEDRFSYDEESIADLAHSIRRDGLIEPLIVVKAGEQYELVAGHRRLMALKYLDRLEAECDVVEYDEEKRRRITFAENFFRQDLSPIELACAISRAYESGEMNVEQLAKGFNKSQDWVKRQLGITQWPTEILAAIHEGAISVAAGANLALIEEPVYRDFLIRQARENGATARATSAWLQAWRNMLPMDAAASTEPLAPGNVAAPLAPQSPCLCCGVVRRMDGLSFVPICPDCIPRVRRLRPGS